MSAQAPRRQDPQIPSVPPKDPRRLSRWRDALVALSLANLDCFRGWGALFKTHGPSAYWLKFEPKPLVSIALMADVLLLGLLFFFVLRGARRLEHYPSGWRRFLLRTMLGLAGYLAAGVLILNFYNGFLDIPQIRALGVVNRWGLIFAEFFALLFPIAYWTGRKRPFRGVVVFLTIMSPLVALTFGQSILQIVNYDRNHLADKPTAPRLPVPASAPHVLWVIFDEWDQDLTFAHRPAGLKLPEIDALRQETFYSDTVATPGPRTDWSMPALTIGHRVSSIEIVRPDELELTLAGGKGTVRWSTYPTVFSEARKLGFNTGILAWALPYCRILNASLTGCDWLTDGNYFDNDTLPEAMATHLRTALETEFRSPFGQALDLRAHAWLYHQLLAKSKRIVSQQEYNLILLHLPIPHLAFFYNRLTGRDDYGANLIRSFALPYAAGYIDALALVDRSIGELRRTMESAGTWDSTSILFSADHPYRLRSRLDGKPMVSYVPFLVKLVGQHQPLNCPERFSALLTHDLLLAILKKEVSTAQELNAWILRHKDAFPAD